MTRSALIAVGGNSLIRAGEKGTIAEQLANARRTAAAIVALLRDGYRIVVTHGNGPQVGAALLRSERASDLVYAQPLDVCGASTQGEIGYLLQQSLRNEITACGLDVPVVSLVTQALVSPTDPAMQHPTKPVGPFYSRAEAEQKQRQFGWTIVEDAARGYRRTVPSPEPCEIIEADVVRRLMRSGTVVVATGGGGIPVMQTPNGLRGVEAVIDKDRASALLASQLEVELLVISTDTDSVYLDYKKPLQRRVRRATSEEMERYYAEGQFPPGNMGPKIEAALRFLKSGGRRVVITSYEFLHDAVAGYAGTQIIPAADAQSELLQAEEIGSKP